MYQAFLVKYAEIGIKGKNRYKFENALCQQMERTLKPLDGEFVVERQQGRIFVEAKGDFDEEDVIAWKDGLAFGDFTQLPVESFNRIPCGPFNKQHFLIYGALTFL